MQAVVTRIPWVQTRDKELMLGREWLVTNGLGGYASGSVGGICTRRYHGFLVAALPAPLGRVVMLAHLLEEGRLPGGVVVQLGGEERAENAPELTSFLSEFRLEYGMPVWRYEVGSFVIEKRIVLPHLQNTVHINYEVLAATSPLRLRLRPSMHFRPIDQLVSTLHRGYSIKVDGEHYEIHSEGEFPPLRMAFHGPAAALVLDHGRIKSAFFRDEKPRGYDPHGTLWTPGYFRCNLAEGQSATLIASTESWDTIAALQPDEALRAEFDRRRHLLSLAHPLLKDGPAAELVFAADQFIISPRSRTADAVRASASGDELRSVIAGYYWFTDWGRDTMISLEGLTLLTGRQLEAGYILRTFSHYIRDGLIPNMFPEGSEEGRYQTVDATLWFFHALERYLAATGDRETLHFLLPKLIDIVGHHLRGTRFGIHVDPADGLLSQAEPTYPLTWMDAKVDDWVVTPRRGKPVEVNALWYNALRLLEGWLRDERGDDAARPIAQHAARARESFNRRFWYHDGNYLYDIIEGEQGDDPALRPNQILAVSLDYPILDRSRWEPVVEAVRRELLTPVGLRSLGRSHTDYKSKYYGDVRARDAAYHQGTVWAWLAGPFIDAWLKLHPHDTAGARGFLDGFIPHLQDGLVGSISEVFDAEEPFTPRGCPAQAWSVAEVIRCWIKTAPPEQQLVPAHEANQQQRA